MTLIHYSRQPLGKVRSAKQGREPGLLHKPRGLWVSVQGEDDWEQWCKAESYELQNLALAHQIVLAGKANLLHIATPEGDRLAERDLSRAIALRGVRSSLGRDRPALSGDNHCSLYLAAQAIPPHDLVLRVGLRQWVHLGRNRYRGG